MVSIASQIHLNFANMSSKLDRRSVTLLKTDVYCALCHHVGVTIFQRKHGCFYGKLKSSEKFTRRFLPKCTILAVILYVYKHGPSLNEHIETGKFTADSCITGCSWRKILGCCLWMPCSCIELKPLVSWVSTSAGIGHWKWFAWQKGF